MRVTLCLVAAMLLASAGRVAAQAETNPLAWNSHREIADWLSTGGVVASIGLDTLHTWQAPDRRAAFACQAFRLVSTAAIAQITKSLVHRVRPDGSDNQSFFSEHTALAAASATGWKLGIGFTVGVGYGRMAADKHYATDVLVGAAVGGLAHLACR